MVYHAHNCGAWHRPPRRIVPPSSDPLSSNMSKTAHAGSEPTFFFHVLQYVFFNVLIYMSLYL
ncbi:hypothetical protein CF140_12765 [Aeromonas sobria]|nr:hypothetical protein CF140_12765 [Aeromonas sobria]